MNLLSKGIMGLFQTKDLKVKNAKMQLNTADHQWLDPSKNTVMTCLDDVWNQQLSFMKLTQLGKCSAVRSLRVKWIEGEIVLHIEIEEENGHWYLMKKVKDKKECERIVSLFNDFGVVDHIEEYDYA